MNECNGRMGRMRVSTLVRVCTLALLLTVAGSGLLFPPTPAAAEPVPGEVTLELTDISPAVTRPGDDIAITGTLSNGTDEALTAPRIQLVLQLHVPATRSALDSWLTSASSFNAEVFAVEYLPDDVPSGASVPFRIEIPADHSPFGSGSTWGPRGIEVRAVSAGQVVAGERSALLWYPDEPQVGAPTEISVIAPLTPTTQEWRAAVEAGVPVLEESAPRLASVLSQMPDDVAWALDSALLESVPSDLPVTDAGEDATAPEEGTSTGTADPSDAAESADPPGEDPQTGSADDAGGTQSPAGTDDDPNTDGATDAGTTPGSTDSTNSTGTGTGAGTGDAASLGDSDPATVLDQLVSGAAERDVIALGYADADQSVLDTSDGLDLLRAGDDRAQSLFAEHGVIALDDVTWPASADQSSLAALAAVDTRAAVLPAAAVPTSETIGYTPSGRTRIETTAGSVEGLLWDEGLSAVLSAQASSLQIRQVMLAQSAVIARERPADARGLLVALERDLGSEAAQLDALTATLEAFDQAPWVESANLRSLLGRTDTGEAREPLPERPAGGSHLRTDTVADLNSAWSQVTAFSQVTEEPAAFRDDLAPQILTGLSAAFTRDPSTRSTVVSTALEGAAALSAQIRVGPGSEVLLIAASGELPITIESDLAVAATVAVRLVPEDPRLRAEETVLAHIPPGGATTARLPVTAVANGNVNVSVVILSGIDGEVLTEADPFRVRVRADWENTGTAIIAVVLALALAFGIVRTIRKGQRRFEPAPRGRGTPMESGAAVPGDRDDGTAATSTSTARPEAKRADDTDPRPSGEDG
ncbi:hypothetical protein IM660_19635 [Ruania alkalisoli]|uniref:Uncharacterized protein n=1 Tax=Ruania alkalisoli TaxID=2779775 RepID=A0A7M1ST52_9MICO|nr:DUF6049 family protein [Ruania alkalisoli]QOR70748.1 hypothetical protein IM660_19635 [Ruania alkalisoli]